MGGESGGSGRGRKVKAGLDRVAYEFGGQVFLLLLKLGRKLGVCGDEAAIRRCLAVRILEGGEEQLGSDGHVFQGEDSLVDFVAVCVVPVDGGSVGLKNMRNLASEQLRVQSLVIERKLTQEGLPEKSGTFRHSRGVGVQHSERFSLRAPVVVQ